MGLIDFIPQARRGLKESRRTEPIESPRPEKFVSEIDQLPPTEFKQGREPTLIEVALGKLREKAKTKRDELAFIRKGEFVSEAIKDRPPRSKEEEYKLLKSAERYGEWTTPTTGGAAAQTVYRGYLKPTATGLIDLISDLASRRKKAEFVSGVVNKVVDSVAGTDVPTLEVDKLLDPREDITADPFEAFAKYGDKIHTDSVEEFEAWKETLHPAGKQAAEATKLGLELGEFFIFLKGGRSLRAKQLENTMTKAKKAKDFTKYKEAEEKLARLSGERGFYKEALEELGPAGTPANLLNATMNTKRRDGDFGDFLEEFAINTTIDVGALGLFRAAKDPKVKDFLKKFFGEIAGVASLKPIYKMIEQTDFVANPEAVQDFVNWAEKERPRFLGLSDEGKTPQEIYEAQRLPDLMMAGEAGETGAKQGDDVAESIQQAKAEGKTFDEWVKEQGEQETGIEKARKIRDEKSLDKKMNYDGKILTKRKIIEKSVDEGATSEIITYEDRNLIQKLTDEKSVLEKNGMQNINANKILDIEKQIQEGVKKQEHRINFPDDSFIKVSKAEYNYFNSIKTRSQLKAEWEGVGKETSQKAPKPEPISVIPKSTEEKTIDYFARKDKRDGAPKYESTTMKGSSDPVYDEIYKKVVSDTPEGQAVIIDSDTIKRNLPGYTVAKETELHVPAREMTNDVLRDAISSDIKGPLKIIAGGSGSGKTELAVERLRSGDGIVWDGTFASKERGDAIIKHAIEEGRHVELYPVITDIEDAWTFNANRAYKSITGEIDGAPRALVPDESLIKRHIGSRENVLRFLENYKNFSIHAIDKTGKKHDFSFFRNYDYDRTGKTARIIPNETREGAIDSLRKILYNRSDAEKRIAFARRKYREKHPDRYKTLFGEGGLEGANMGRRVSEVGDTSKQRGLAKDLPVEDPFADFGKGGGLKKVDPLEVEKKKIIDRFYNGIKKDFDRDLDLNYKGDAQKMVDEIRAHEKEVLEEANQGSLRTIAQEELAKEVDSFAKNLRQAVTAGGLPRIIPIARSLGMKGSPTKARALDFLFGADAPSIVKRAEKSTSKQGREFYEKVKKLDTISEVDSNEVWQMIAKKTRELFEPEPAKELRVKKSPTKKPQAKKQGTKKPVDSKKAQPAPEAQKGPRPEEALKKPSSGESIQISAKKASPPRDVTIGKHSKPIKWLLERPGVMKTQESIQDSWVRVKRLMQQDGIKFTDESNPYLKEILFHGRVGSALEKLDIEIGDFLKTARKTAESLDLNPDKLRKEINEYLVAKHAPERNLALGDGAAGISNEAAAKRLKEIESLPYFNEIKKAADELLEMNKKTLEILREGQVISDEMYETLTKKYKNHVPLQRVFEESEIISDVLNGGKGFNVRGTGIKKAKGSKREVSDIVGNITANLKQAIIRSEKNRVDLSTLRFFRENKKELGNLFEEVKPKAIGEKFGKEGERAFIMQNIQDPLTISVRENGKPVFLKVNDPFLAKAFQGVNADMMPQHLRLVALITRTFAGLATRFNPEFAFSNIVRDVQDLIINSAAMTDGKGAVKAATSVPASARDVLDWVRGADTKGARLYEQMKLDGGTTGGLGLSTKAQVDIDIKKLEKLAKSRPRRFAKGVIETVDNFNMVFEDASRLSAYKGALSRGLSREQAAFIAKNATVNFNKKGTAGPIINGLWMFANASIQGSTRILKSMTNPKVAIPTLATVGAVSSYSNLFNDTQDPEWRSKIPKYVRNHNLVFVLSKEGDDEIRYFKIPVSWGLKPLFVLSNSTYEQVNGIETDKSGDKIVDVLSSFVDAYNPIGGEDAMSAVTPTILDLPLDIARNKKWTGSLMYPTWKEDLTGPEKVFRDPETAKERAAMAASEFLYQTRIPALQGISPEVLEYSFDTLTSGVGRATTRFLDTAAGLVSGDIKKTEGKDIFILNRFYGKSTKDQWEKSAKYEKKDEILSEIKKTRDLEERKDLIREYVYNLPLEEQKGALYSLREGGLDTGNISTSANPHAPKAGAPYEKWYGFFRNKNREQNGIRIDLTKKEAEDFAKAKVESATTKEKLDYEISVVKKKSGDELKESIKGLKKSFSDEELVEMFGVDWVIKNL